MSDDFDRAKDLFKWNERVFAIMGVWPLQLTYAKFAPWIVYLLIHLSMEFADLFHVFGDLELMILNLSETSLEIMILLKLMVMRFSQTLAKVMKRVIDAIDTTDVFETPEEKNIYLSYNRIAKTFFRIWFVMGITTAIVYHMKPLEFRLKAVLQNESMPFVLPYRARLFFVVNDSSTFWLVWIYQSPMMCIHASFPVTAAYVFSIVLHVTGQLAVLAHRIKSLEFEPLDNNPDRSRQIFRDIVETHCRILRLAKDIENVFHLVLLEELFISTTVVCLAAYTVLVNASIDDTGLFLSFLTYCATMLYLIYGYCVAGQYLISESNNVHEAYYQCGWYDWSRSCKKQLTICMLGAMKPIQLTGGGFYIFCSASFTSVLKSAMGYISVLRTIV